METIQPNRFWKVSARLAILALLVFVSSAAAQLTVTGTNQLGSVPLTPAWIAAPGSLLAGLAPIIAIGNLGEYNGATASNLTKPGITLAIYTASSTQATNLEVCGDDGTAGALLVYTLPAATYGYNLTNLTVYGGWQDAGRDAQDYTVYYSTIANPNFFWLLTNVSYIPLNNANTGDATRVVINDAAGAAIARNVAALKFDYTAPDGGSRENGAAGYTAITVGGTMATNFNTPPEASLPTASPATNLFVGDSVVLSEFAQGATPLQFQWLRNGFVIPGSTNSSLTLSNLALTAASNYRVIVSNNYGAVTSAPVVLSVKLANIPAGYVAVTGVGAGAFSPALWQSGPPNLIPDYRFPWLSPLAGAYRNIYAPSAVQTPTGDRIFYGGWDGIATGNDHIYSLTTDSGFQIVANRHQVVQPGTFQHICNVNALGFEDGSYAMFGTLYPVGSWNKPAFFRSDTTGANWNGGLGEPYTVVGGDVISLTGYANWANADINGLNVMLFENGVYRLYFADFNNFNGVNRATSIDGKNYTYDGQVLNGTYAVNDVKSFLVGGTNYYLMGMHLNGASLWYSLSTNGLQFPAPPTTLLNYQNAASDRYIVSMGWVVSGAQATPGRKLIGVLYGAGPSISLSQNSIFARWFQKKVVFAADNGNRYPGTYALGPDCQLLSIPAGQLNGHFEYYAEDGVTLTGVSGTLTISQGQSYQMPVNVISIPKLFNTGVSTEGALLGGNTTDPHYTLLTSADAGYPGPNVVTVNAAWPIAPAGPWLANGPASAWIAPLANQTTGNVTGIYTYRTTFDLTGYDPATASIAGNVAVDDALTDLRLNGLSLGTSSSGFASFTGFTIAAGSTNFMAGTNTLDFVVLNGGTVNNPAGLRVEMSGTVAVPLPTLTAVSSSGQIVLSWPVISGGYSLFSTPSLSPAVWTLYSGTSTTNSGQITVSVHLSGPTGFFRLQK